MKIFGIWFTYTVLGIALVFAFCKFATTNENRVESAVTVTVVKLLQEDHKSSTTYRGIFLLPNGKYTDFVISPSTFATSEIGEKLSFNLNKYETKEAVDTPEGFLWGVLYFVLIVVYLIGGAEVCSRMVKFHKAYPKAKLRLDKW